MRFQFRFKFRERIGSILVLSTQMYSSKYYHLDLKTKVVIFMKG